MKEELERSQQQQHLSLINRQQQYPTIVYTSKKSPTTTTNNLEDYPHQRQQQRQFVNKTCTVIAAADSESDNLLSHLNRHRHKHNLLNLPTSNTCETTTLGDNKNIE